MKKEKFELGEEVFLIHLQQTGVVKRWSGADLLFVEVDGDEIPVFISDVAKETGMKKKEIETDTNKDKPEVTAAKPQPVSANSGIFITFEPVYVHGEEISSYNIYLINDTPQAIDFEYYFLIKGKVMFPLKKPIPSHHYVLLHSIEHDELNESPQLQLNIRDVMNNVFTAKMEQRIKPQNFFNKLQVPPMFSQEHYCYRVPLAEIKPVIPTPPAEPVVFDPERLKMQMQDSVIQKDVEIGEPVEEIDLHIEKLSSDYRSMSNSDMMKLQLDTFEQALNRAIAHHSQKLYVIHGLGSGKLKSEIHHILRQYKEVKSFSNENHPRYGYGATEVILH